MKVVLKKTGPHSFEADPVDRSGSPRVGRGRTLLEAYGNFLIQYQDELGLKLVVDSSAWDAENRRRKKRR
jgi:hypothetical protein